MQKQFANSVAGNFTVMFALILFPVTAMAGLAIDYRAQLNAQAKVQSIMDQAVLATAKSYRDPADQDEAQNYINGLIKEQLRLLPKELSCTDAILTVPDDDRQIEATIACKKPLELLQVLGIDEIDFTVEAAAAWGVDNLEVVFVLDMSGSMAAHLGDLQTALTSILDVLVPEDGDAIVENTRVGMVTFNTFLNAGSLFEAATGLSPIRTYLADDTFNDAAGNPVTESRQTTISSTCVLERIGDFAYSDAPPDPTPPGEIPLLVPLSVIDAAVEADEHPGDENLFHHESARNNPYGFVSAPYAAFTDRSGREDPDFYNSPGRACNTLGPLPLTDVRSNLDDYVSSLYTGGYTSGHQGIAFGWYLLSDKWAAHLPADSVPASYEEDDTMKVMIFLTDGRMDAGYNFGFGNGEPQARALCDAIKAETNIRIFSIGYLLNEKSLDLVKYCASEPAFAFAPDGAASLTEAFDEILDVLVNLRVSA